MARRRRFEAARDNSLIATFPDRMLVSRFLDLAALRLSLSSDLRRWSPGPQVARASWRPAARLVVGRQPGHPRQSLLRARLPSVVAFADPRRVDICRRREIRRRVLLAKGVGGSRVRKPRRNQWSEVSC